jgi:hypothetical protein
MTKSETYISFIANELRSGNVVYKDVLKLFLSEFKCSEPTFVTYWKRANDKHRIARIEADKQADEAIIQHTKENALNAIKTKNQRLEVYQKQIDATIDEIENGMTGDTIFVGGAPKKIMRKHTVNETAILRRTLRDLQSEISKIEGDYAPTKQDVKLEDTRPSTKIKLNDGTEIEM